jgi:polysaccharide export outer membrane protein
MQLFFAASLWLSLAGSQAAAPAAVPARQAPVPDYEIGPDDLLKITVYGHEDLTQTALVQGDGTIGFPLIGRIVAAGLTTNALASELRERLATGFIRNPHVTVVVQEYRSKAVFVVGEVSKPGTYPLSGSMTIVEILSRAGPLGVNAGSEVLVIRPQADVGRPLLPTEVVELGSDAVRADLKRAEVLKVNLRDIQTGDLSKNVVLRPHDTVYVPQAPKVFVSGEVRTPGAYAFAPGMTVRQLISLAGGFGERASTGRLRVVRASNGKTQEQKIRIDDVVQPGDTVLVKQKLF